MVNRKSKELDQYIDKLVEIIFWDGRIRVGTLKFNQSYWGRNNNTNMYSLEELHLFFRKTHIKNIKEI